MKKAEMNVKTKEFRNERPKIQENNQNIPMNKNCITIAIKTSPIILKKSMMICTKLKGYSFPVNAVSNPSERNVLKGERMVRTKKI